VSPLFFFFFFFFFFLLCLVSASVHDVHVHVYVACVDNNRRGRRRGGVLVDSRSLSSPPYMPVDVGTDRWGGPGGSTSVGGLTPQSAGRHEGRHVAAAAALLLALFFFSIFFFNPFRLPREGRECRDGSVGGGGRAETRPAGWNACHAHIHEGALEEEAEEDEAGP
jgi:hypothetical protein